MEVNVHSRKKSIKKTIHDVLGVSDIWVGGVEGRKERDRHTDTDRVIRECPQEEIRCKR